MVKLTMHEIAKRANVSQPTVSRVINGHKGVSQENVNAVMRVIEEVGYIPNKAAQTLKRSSTNIIGVCVKEIYNPYFVEILDSLELEARKHGYSILFHHSKFNPVTEWENIQNFVSRQVDGIIIVPTSDFNLERISKLEIPTIVITQSQKLFDSVGLNHLQAGKLAGESFIHSGHQTFGYIGAERDEDKFRGFEQVLQENGFVFHTENFIQIHETSQSSFMIRKEIENYLGQADKLDFTCLFAGNDIMALEMMKAAQERHIRIPEDVSIIGFDDTYLSKMMEISSIHQPIGDMVKTTFEVLLNRIHQETSSSLVTIMMEPALIERKSSKFRRR
ncbi:LacI family DNA-binding transcriptional regulator [Paenibacillus sp. CF384]|uniref:LacI family DNA-binding transcriptional regulator n=1 Tax=Paenibacillus sp. CF384 TaxID=1884382 RepID=UPI00089991CB|nr:LacI family DNA-binding transcriptional regulator [Paenibacillus sp. CF384]SDX06537.1 transcriptional regulator, LacI family [Paenibacillus sp. CF384]